MEENTTHCQEFTTTFEVDRDQTPIDAFDTIKYIRGWLGCDCLSSWM